jgi:hypothetical protein
MTLPRRGRDDHTGRATSQPVTQTAHRSPPHRDVTRPDNADERSEITCLDPFGEVLAPCRELR